MPAARARAAQVRAPGDPQQRHRQRSEQVVTVSSLLHMQNILPGQQRGETRSNDVEICEKLQVCHWWKTREAKRHEGCFSAQFHQNPSMPAAGAPARASRSRRSSRRRSGTSSRRGTWPATCTAWSARRGPVDEATHLGSIRESGRSGFQDQSDSIYDSLPPSIPFPPTRAAR